MEFHSFSGGCGGSVRCRNKFADWPVALKLMPVKVIIPVCVCVRVCVFGWCVGVSVYCFSVSAHGNFYLSPGIAVECDEYIRWLVGNSSTFNSHPIHFAAQPLSPGHRHISLGRIVLFFLLGSLCRTTVGFLGEKFDSGTERHKHWKIIVEDTKNGTTSKKRCGGMSATKNISIKKSWQKQLVAMEREYD